MEKFQARQFTARYNRIMLYTLSAVLLVSIILIAIQTISKQKHNKIQLIDQFKTESVAIDNLIVRVTVLLNLMQSDAEAFLINPRSKGSTLYENVSSIGGNQYGLDTIPMPYEKVDAANLTGDGDILTLLPKVKDEIEMAFTLNSAFKSISQSIPNAAWVYYTSKNHFINIYPWVHSSEFKFSSELYEKDFYTLGVPEKNPDKIIFWTPIYLDEAGKGMMVTAAKPVYRQKEFLGTLAIDFTLGELADYVKGFRQGKGQLFMVNSYGQLIAHPHIALTNKTVFKDALPSQVDMALADLSCDGLSLSDLTKGYQYICYQMKNAPWKVIYLEEIPHILTGIFSFMGALFITLLLALGFLVFLMKRITFREFIYPAELLVRHIFHQGINEQDNPHPVPSPWLPWFSKITDTFEQNRTLINEIKKKNTELTDLNISLERYMPKFVLVISLDDGRSGAQVGSYFTDVLAKNNTDKKTAYLEYPGFRNISADFGYDKTELIHQHKNGFEIWNDFDLGDVPVEAQSSLLMTKLLNQYTNIVMHSTIKGDLESFIETYLEPLFRYSKAIVVMVPDDDHSLENSTRVVKKIQEYVRQDQTTVHTLANPMHEKVVTSPQVDFEIPFAAELRAFSQHEFAVPKQAQGIINEMVDRIERVHQISVFIPTTINIDEPFDSSIYVEKAMLFLGEKFGGATSSQARGVWNSDESGMVNELVHLVVSYTTEDDLNRFANEVIEFIKGLKQELNQEAMALEINKKLILV